MRETFERNGIQVARTKPEINSFRLILVSNATLMSIGPMCLCLADFQNLPLVETDSYHIRK